MPSWAIHISMANELNKKLKLDDNFIIGNVLPDTHNGHIVKNASNIFNHSITHYNFEGVGVPPVNNFEKYIEDYNDKLNNPLILGALIHIITDNYFNQYTRENHVKIDNGRRVAILNDGSILENVLPWKIKQRDFQIFADSLVNEKKVGNVISIMDDTNKLSKDFNYPITKQDLINTVDEINHVITKSEFEEKQYMMFTKEELEKLYNDCLNYLDDIIENLNMKNKIKIKGRG